MGTGVNKLATVAMVSGVLLVTSALAYGVARASSGHTLPLKNSRHRGRREPLEPLEPFRPPSGSDEALAHSDSGVRAKAGQRPTARGPTAGSS